MSNAIVNPLSTAQHRPTEARPIAPRVTRPRAFYAGGTSGSCPRASIAARSSKGRAAQRSDSSRQRVDYPGPPTVTVRPPPCKGRRPPAPT